MSIIKSNCTDAELSAAVAEHVAGIDPNALTENDHWVKTRIIYATSADAVLPLLEKFSWTCDYNLPGYRAIIRINPGRYHLGSATTFARAACFALLRAKGWNVEDAT